MPRQLVPAVLANYWWTVPLLAVGSLLVVDGSRATAFVGSLLGVVYFIQKQRVAELELFHRLFREFNERYDGMNGRLLQLLGRDGELDLTDRQLLTDYFNLCAEEYLFFSRGLIPPEVWKAWCRGMAGYLSDRRIGEFWELEAATDSYYGLSRDIIRMSGISVPPSQEVAGLAVRDRAA